MPRIQRAPLVARAAMGPVAACSTTGVRPGPVREATAPVPIVARTVLATTARLVGLAEPDAGEGPRCFGAEVAAEARHLLDRQGVRIVAGPGWPLRYGDGRMSVYVWLDSGRMANHAQVEGGFALEATGAPSHVYRGTFAVAKERAHHEGRELWLRPCAANTARRPA